MEVSYHPLVKRDMAEALRYYHAVTAKLADEFEAEARSAINRAAEHPLQFHLVEKGIRRINLPRFPYHVLYDIRGESMRVMLIRHNKRHPDYGMDRN